MAYSEYKVCKPLQVKGDSTTVNLRLLYIYLGQKHTFYTQYFDTSSIREYRKKRGSVSLLCKIGSAYMRPEIARLRSLCGALGIFIQSVSSCLSNRYASHSLVYQYYFALT